MISLCVALVVGFVQDARYSKNVNLDSKTGVWDVWFKNTGKVAFRLKIIDCTFNYYKVDLKLPYTLELLPSKSATIKVKSLDPAALKYGKSIYVTWKVFVKGEETGGGSIGEKGDYNPPSIGGSAILKGNSIKGYEVSLSNMGNGSPVQMKDLSISYAGKPLSFDLFPKTYKYLDFPAYRRSGAPVRPVKIPPNIIELPQGTSYVIANVPSLDGVKSMVKFKWRGNPKAPWETYTAPFTSNRSELLDRIK